LSPRPAVVPAESDGFESEVQSRRSHWCETAFYVDLFSNEMNPVAHVAENQVNTEERWELPYVACDLADRTPKQVERLYRKRSAIETSYRVFRQTRVVTTTQDPIIRFAFVLVGFLLENLWLVLRWAVVARPQRGGRDLPEEFTFKTFSDWIRHALEEELERTWEIEMNGTGVPEAYAPAAG